MCIESLPIGVYEHENDANLSNRSDRERIRGNRLSWILFGETQQPHDKIDRIESGAIQGNDMCHKYLHIANAFVETDEMRINGASSDEKGGAGRVTHDRPIKAIYHVAKLCSRSSTIVCTM